MSPPCKIVQESGVVKSHLHPCIPFPPPKSPTVNLIYKQVQKALLLDNGSHHCGFSFGLPRLRDCLAIQATSNSLLGGHVCQVFKLKSRLRIRCFDDKCEQISQTVAAVYQQ